MLTEQLIRQNEIRHRELLAEAAAFQKMKGVENGSAVGEALARAGDLLVAVGQGLQRRYRRMEQDAALADYGQGQRMGRAL
ncbi:MAG: hypothetical protein WBO46_17990 [Caldilineaceae bacterium]